MVKKIMRITTVPIALKVLLEGQMKFMSENGFNVIMVSADGKEREALMENENCLHIIVEMTRRITPFRDFISLLKMCRIIRKYKPDIVHTHTPKAGLIGMLAARICGIKIRIHTVAGLPLMAAKGPKLILLKAIEKITYSAAAQIWPNSYSIKNYILENKFTSEKKLSVIGKGSSNGIDLKKYNSEIIDSEIQNNIKRCIQYDSNNIYLLFVGRMVSDKGVTELVEAFEILQRKIFNLKLLLVGPFEKELDPLTPSILRTIKKNQSIFHIEWSDHVAAYMSLANYFVFPSHREGFPNVLLQAGALSLPVICSNIPGNIDIVEDGVTGFIFKVGDKNDLEKTILKAMENREISEKMAINLSKKINENFDRQIIWNKILKKYQNLIGSSN